MDGCVTAPAAWASPPGRRRNSVHRSVEMASRRRFGAFVYTVAPRVAIRIATRAASGSGPLVRTLPPDAPPSVPDHSEPRTSQVNNHLSDAEPDKLCPLVGRRDLRPSVRKMLPLVYATRRATLRRDFRETRRQTGKTRSQKPLLLRLQPVPMGEFGRMVLASPRNSGVFEVMSAGPLYTPRQPIGHTRTPSSRG